LLSAFSLQLYFVLRAACSVQLYSVFAFGFQPSAFSLQLSAFSFQPSAFSLQLSAFSFQPSAFSLQLSAFSCILYCV
jgi:hypothetical protein